jgi:hypothetical protein
MSAFEPNRTDTPTQYDLARWLYEQCQAIEPVTTVNDGIARMATIMLAIRPENARKP